jgi:hypothetical protein
MTAAPGNKNALKHGLYAKFFNPESIKAIRKIAPDDLLQEIAVLRQTISKILDVFDNRDPNTLSKQINALATASTTLNLFIRTHAMLTGNYTPMNISFEEALDHVTPYTTDPQHPMQRSDSTDREGEQLGE